MSLIVFPLIFKLQLLVGCSQTEFVDGSVVFPGLGLDSNFSDEPIFARICSHD